MNNRYFSNLAFVDLLFNLILGFVFLFLISFLLINTPEKVSEVEQKAEIMIVLHWEDMHEGDIDLWVSGPSGVVSYVKPQVGTIYLDKDDLGVRNDFFFKPNGEKSIVRINREVMNVRGFEPGEYIVNAHYYGGDPASPPANVTVEVIKLNPFNIIHTSSYILQSRGAEHTFVRFEMDHTGKIFNINYLPKQIVSAGANFP